MISFGKLKLPDDPVSSNLVAGAIATAIAAVTGALYPYFVDRLAQFDVALLSASGVLFLVGSAALLSTTKLLRQPMLPAVFYVGGIVVATALLMSIPVAEYPATRSSSSVQATQTQNASASAASASSSQAKEKGQASPAAHLLLLLPSVALLFGFLWQSAAAASESAKTKQVRHTVGFAATGILCVQSGPDAANFLLILNRNLRNKKGLWVPPGGHVDIYSESPEGKVREKVLLETGYDTELVEVHSAMLPTKGARTTDLCSWYVPPAFWLREDLQGDCSKFHKIHIDFVYILKATNPSPTQKAKYGHADFLWVPVKECAASHEGTKLAIERSIDGWRCAQGLAPAALADNYTADLTLRLHLAAKHLTSFTIP